MVQSAYHTVGQEAKMNITELIGEPPEGVYTRRHLIRFAAGSAAALGTGGLLAACGSSPSSSASSAAAAAPVRHVGGPVNLFTWQGYDLTKPFAPWRKQEGITETVKYLSNQFDVAALLKGPN